MNLVIQIKDVCPGTWGWTCAGGWESPVNTRIGIAQGEECYHLWTLDPNAIIGRNQYGHCLKLHPSMGIMGIPPDETDLHPSAPPRVWGGNIDCKELVAGSTLYLPISVPLGLFSVGDDHTVQADGK